jgi:heme exporter protein C
MHARLSRDSRALAPFDWSIVVAVLAVAGVAVRAIWFTPIEARQGPAQKIFYVHPPSAFVGLYIGFGLMAVSSAVYLWLRDERADLFAESSGEVGLAFLTVALVTGPIWGKTVWGAWWTWDARLTSTLFLWFLVAGYLVLRGAIDDRALRARYSAVLALLSVPLILFIHLSVYFFRTLHPMPIVFKPSEPSLPPEMLETFGLAFVAMLLLYIALVRARYRLALAREYAEDIA